MKKLKIIIILFVFIFLLFLSTFLVFPSEISYNSNVPVTLNEVLRKYGPLYIGFFPLKQAEIKRTFFHLDINYIEPTSIVVKFKNGIFAVTESGHLILSNQNNFDVVANFESSNYNNTVMAFLIALKNCALFGPIKYIEFFNKDIAFRDNNGISVIIGKEDFMIKLEEYNKVINLFKSDIKKIQTIDLRFNLQAVVKWRDNG